MSDVAAMGGEVFALNIAAFPPNLPLRAGEILRGGAGGALSWCGHRRGTHDPGQEPKYGLAVTGIVHPDRISRRAAPVRAMRLC